MTSRPPSQVTEAIRRLWSRRHHWQREFSSRLRTAHGAQSGREARAARFTPGCCVSANGRHQSADHHNPTDPTKRNDASSQRPGWAATSHISSWPTCADMIAERRTGCGRVLPPHRCEAGAGRSARSPLSRVPLREPRSRSCLGETIVTHSCDIGSQERAGLRECHQRGCPEVGIHSTGSRRSTRGDTQLRGHRPPSLRARERAKRNRARDLPKTPSRSLRSSDRCTLAVSVVRRPPRRIRECR